jgi:prepilin-type N-terminal cleavage/methylation domain-containing protein
MVGLFKAEKGFTLVELMIVVVIVGILAGVSIPMYSRSAERARISEAVGALGSIRSAMRIYYAEHRTYENNSFKDGERVTKGGVLYVTEAGLDGRYFSTECYHFDGDATADSFKIKAIGDSSTAPEASTVAGLSRYIDQAGNVTK